MIVVYVAHALGNGEDRELNRRRASYWAAWIAWEFRVSISADWIILSGEWPETPEFRQIGLAADLEMVRRADQVWCVGEKMTDGMRAEAMAGLEWGKTIRDLTGLSTAEIKAKLGRVSL